MNLQRYHGRDARAFRAQALLLGIIAFLSACSSSTITGQAATRISASPLVPAGANKSDPQWVTQRTPHSEVALVFVHGLFGDTLDAWRADNGTTFFALVSQDPEIGKHVDVFAFGYPSFVFATGSFSIHEAANRLYSRLKYAGVLSYHKVVFVAHSMGGLVVLETILDHADVAQLVPLVVLYSTPQEGTDIARIADHVARNPALKSLVPINENDGLMYLANRWQSLNPRPRVVCAYEKLDTDGLRIVQWASATRFCDGASAAIDANHVDIVKPRSRLSDSYVTFANAFTDLILVEDKPSQAPPPRQLDGSSSTFAPPVHSLAVLPFVNISADARQEYFSDGFTEELINALAQFDDLQVVARTSSFSFKGQNADISTIAHKLNVGNILEGSVRRSGNTVRITVTLINAISGLLIWSRTYDSTLNDNLKVQTTVATAVAQQLEVKLIGDEAAKIQAGGTNSAEAYDDYLQGEQLLNNADGEEDLRAAASVYDRAINIDPNYAAAYVGRANALSNISFATSNLDAREKVRVQAITSAERAVALAPELGDPHVVLAITLRNVLDFVDAARENDRALALAPGSAKVQRNFATFAAELGHYAPAVIAARRAVALDPQNFFSHFALAHVFYLARRYAEALAALQDAEALDPGSAQIGIWLVSTLLASHHIGQAQQKCESPTTPLGDINRHGCLALVYHALGRKADAERQLEQLRTLAGDAAAYSYAEIYAQWGRKGTALQWLSTAERLRDPALQLLKVDWQLDPIRNEPRYKAIETRMNFPP